MKKILLIFIFAIGIVSTAFATKDTIMVSTPTQVYHFVSGNPVLVTSINVNVGDTIVVQNASSINADFTMNTTNFNSICGTMCSFQYKVLPTDVPNFLVKAFVPLNSTTYNLITVYVNNVSTGVTKQNNLISYNVYPNPAKNVFAISSLRTANISVYNQLGCLVKQQSFEYETISLNIADLPHGIYMVEVLADGKRSVSKLVKE